MRLIARHQNDNAVTEGTMHLQNDVALKVNSTDLGKEPLFPPLTNGSPFFCIPLHNFKNSCTINLTPVLSSRQTAFIPRPHLACAFNNA